MKLSVYLRIHSGFDIVCILDKHLKALKSGHSFNLQMPMLFSAVGISFSYEVFLYPFAGCQEMGAVQTLHPVVAIAMFHPFQQATTRTE